MCSCLSHEAEKSFEKSPLVDYFYETESEALAGLGSISPGHLSFFPVSGFP